MTDKFSIEKDAIRALADILVETDLTEIEYENEGHRIRVARNTNMNTTVALAPQTQVHATAPAIAETIPAKQSAENALKSPMVGTVYVANEPGVAAFISVGDSVVQGQTLLIIEAMKVMNPIKSPRSGKIAAIMITDGQPVEFGEPLLILE